MSLSRQAAVGNISFLVNVEPVESCDEEEEVCELLSSVFVVNHIRSLNNITSLNSLDSKDKDALWTPRLGFVNALGPLQTEVDKMTTGVLVREDQPLDEDPSLPIEGKMAYDD